MFPSRLDKPAKDRRPMVIGATKALAESMVATKRMPANGSQSFAGTTLFADGSDTVRSVHGREAARCRALFCHVIELRRLRPQPCWVRRGEDRLGKEAEEPVARLNPRARQRHGGAIPSNGGEMTSQLSSTPGGCARPDVTQNDFPEKQRPPAGYAAGANIAAFLKVADAMLDKQIV